MIEVDEIRRFLTVLHNHAAWATAHLVAAGRDPGQLQLTAVHPTMINPRTGKKESITPGFTIGDVEGMTNCAANCARLGYNVWTQGRTCMVAH